MSTSIMVSTASRRGIREHNADAAAEFVTVDGSIGVAVIDAIGNSPKIAALSPVLALVAARVGAQRGGLAGVLSAAQLVADPGAGPEPEPDAVAVLAVAEPGEPTSITWVGDCRAYGFMWNLKCQVHAALPWFTAMIGRSVAVAGMPMAGEVQGCPRSRTHRNANLDR